MHDSNDLRNRTHYEYEHLLACGQPGALGPEAAQLPSPPMLMLDKITEISLEGGTYGKGVVRAELSIRPDLWFFDCHFKGDPVMPGCLGLDALWQMLGFFLAWSGGKGRGRALGTGEIKFSGMILPETKKVEYEVDVRRTLQKGILLGIADGKVKADGEEVYIAKSLRVGLFRTEDGAENLT